ncbi:MAG TPA: outer membrane beta-barrel protein [Candidatus Babeliaceae bacterium]|nr:outer membrane beta-barrel protein [Candidatus Babeliaceae bacterium]
MKSFSFFSLFLVLSKIACGTGFYIGLDVAYPNLKAIEAFEGKITDAMVTNVTTKSMSTRKVLFYPSFGYRYDFKDCFISLEAYLSTLRNKVSTAQEYIGDTAPSTETKFYRRNNIGIKAKLGYEVAPTWFIYYGLGLDKISYVQAIEYKERNIHIGDITSKKGSLYSLTHTIGLSKKIDNKWSVYGEYFFLHPKKLAVVEGQNQAENLKFKSRMNEVTFSTFKVGVQYSF